MLSCRILRWTCQIRQEMNGDLREERKEEKIAEAELNNSFHRDGLKTFARVR